MLTTSTVHVSAGCVHELEASAIDHVRQDEHDGPGQVAPATRAWRTGQSLPAPFSIVLARRDRLPPAQLLQGDVRAQPARAPPVGLYQQVHAVIQHLLPEALRPQDRASLPRGPVRTVAPART